MGKVAGVLVLSYQGAKIGAKAGRLLDKESRIAMKEAKIRAKQETVE